MTTVSAVTPSVKKARMQGKFLLDLTVPHTGCLADCEHLDPDTSVLCFTLSQETRKISDKKVGDRPAFIMPHVNKGESTNGAYSKVGGMNWAEFLAKDEYTIHKTRNLVSVEAYKVLEKEFSTQMATTGKMRSFEVLMDWLQNLVLSVVSSLNYPEQDDDWYKWVPFGIFSEALRRLLDMRDSTSPASTSYLKNLLTHAKDFYMEVMKLVVGDLVEDSASILKDDKVDSAVDYMKDEHKFEQIVREWASVAGKRVDRNISAHPFDTDSKERHLAIKFYEQTLVDSYSDEFRHLGYLTLLKLQTIEAKREAKRRDRATQDAERLMQEFESTRLRFQVYFEDLITFLCRLRSTCSHSSLSLKL